MKKLSIVTLTLCLLCTVSVVAQKDVFMSQYMHNRFAINPAFAGNREALSLFGSYRQKWMGINGSPGSQFFSGHTALKNRHIGLGVDVYNQSYGVSGNTGASFTYAYRLFLGNNQKLSFAVSGGFASISSQWSKVRTLDEFDIDPLFAANETIGSPIAGFGTAWYSDRFFVGLSVPNFFSVDMAEPVSAEFEPNRINYLLTGGYLFTAGEKLAVQPAFLARYNASETSFVDANATVIYNELIWVGASYRTTKDVVALLGYQITPQLRFSYSFDYTLGDIATYNNGTHEISIQFDFGYKIATPHPKFF